MRGKKWLKDLFQEPIGSDDEDEFAFWAFGPEYRDIVSGIKFMDAWNELHGDELMLDPTDIIGDSAVKMVALWRSKR